MVPGSVFTRGRNRRTCLRNDAAASGASTHLENRGCTVVARDLEATRNRGSVPKRDSRSRRGVERVRGERRSQVGLDRGCTVAKLGVHTR